MKKYEETKSRHSVTRDFGGQVSVKTRIPENPVPCSRCLVRALAPELPMNALGFT